MPNICCRADKWGGRPATAAAGRAVDATEPAGGVSIVQICGGSCQGGTVCASSLEGWGARGATDLLWYQLLATASAPASAGCAFCRMLIPATGVLILQMLFGALWRCQRLDLRGCALLDGSVFGALAGAAASLTDLDCEGIGNLSFAMPSSQTHMQACDCEKQATQPAAPAAACRAGGSRRQGALGSQQTCECKSQPHWPFPMGVIRVWVCRRWPMNTWRPWRCWRSWPACGWCVRGACMSVSAHPSRSRQLVRLPPCDSDLPAIPSVYLSTDPAADAGLQMTLVAMHQLMQCLLWCRPTECCNPQMPIPVAYNECLNVQAWRRLEHWLRCKNWSSTSLASTACRRRAAAAGAAAADVPVAAGAAPGENGFWHACSTPASVTSDSCENFAKWDPAVYPRPPWQTVHLIVPLLAAGRSQRRTCWAGGMQDIAVGAQHQGRSAGPKTDGRRGRWRVFNLPGTPHAVVASIIPYTQLAGSNAQGSCCWLQALWILRPCSCGQEGAYRVMTM